MQHKVNEEYPQEYIENREQEESRKSTEDEKLKVETEKKVSEAALKRLERDREDTSAVQRHRVSLKSDSELRRKS